MLLMVVTLSVGGGASTEAATPAAVPSKTDRVVVKFKSAAAGLRQIAALDTPIADEVRPLGVKVLQAGAGGADELAAKLNGDPNVLYAETAKVFRASVTPNDEQYPAQYGHLRIQSPKGWALGKGASSVKLAVVDTGIDLTHEDLSARYVGGYDFFNEDSSPYDDHGHGTHVAGIAAATGNNGVGVAGVGWYTGLLGVKVLGADGSGTDPDIAEGIVWAADQGASVINMSLGGYDSSQVLADAVAYARAKGALVVAAAGNDGVDVPSYPAALPGVIGVAATDVNDARAGFSNFGSYVDVSAPGVSVISTLPDDQYGYLSGTSMSTPFVAGAAAVLKARYPSYTAGQLWGRIRDGADDLGAKGYDRYTGYGRLNLFRALAISGTVYGVVRDSRNASALSNVKVSLQNSTSYVLTNGAGSYSFANLSHGSRSLVYSRWGYLSQSRTLSVQAGRSVRADVALTPLARISGYVLDRAGRPLSGATVRIAGTYRSDVTDSTGKYILTLVPTGSKSVVAGKSLYVSVARALTTRPGITHRLDFRLLKQGVLTGRITDKATGAALAGVVVGIEGVSQTATTSSTGVYTIQGVPPGVRKATTTRAGYVPGAREIAFANDQTSRADFTLTRRN